MCLSAKASNEFLRLRWARSLGDLGLCNEMTNREEVGISEVTQRLLRCLMFGCDGTYQFWGSNL